MASSLALAEMAIEQLREQADALLCAVLSLDDLREAGLHGVVARAQECNR